MRADFEIVAEKIRGEIRHKLGSRPGEVDLLSLFEHLMDLKIAAVINLSPAFIEANRKFHESRDDRRAIESFDRDEVAGKDMTGMARPRMPGGSDF